jgi:hypothetical protein
MANIAVKLLEAPDPTHGHTIGAPIALPSDADSVWGVAVWDENVWAYAEETDGDLSFAVEMLTPESETSVWGVARWGEDVWSELDWLDLTEHWRGCEWTRGGARSRRAEVGELAITLDSEGGRFSRSATPAEAFGGTPGYFAPGSVIRVVYFIPDGAWWPEITGVVRSWPEQAAGVGAVEWVTIHAGETVGMLSRVDELALDTPVGAGDTPDVRMERLLDGAEWPYGFVYTDPDYAFGTPTLQATTMAGNRLAEAYLTADSVGMIFRSDRYGRASLHPRPPASAVEHVSDYEADALVTANDDEAIINQVSLAVTDGTATTFVNALSRGRFGPRTYSRNDLIADHNGLLLRQIGEDILARNSQEYRPVSVRLYADENERVRLLLITADIETVVDVASPRVLFHNYAISSYTHRVAPLPPNRVWAVTDVTFEPTAASDWTRVLTESHRTFAFDPGAVGGVPYPSEDLYPSDDLYPGEP